MFIGSHCSMKSPDYLLGSVKEALSYDANALMVYTGAPQSGFRTELDKLKIEEAHQLMSEYGIDKRNLVIHAPYIINIGNTVKESTFDNGVEILKNEIERATAFGAHYMVLHPGAHVGGGADAAIDAIIKGLDIVNEDNDELIIALETMAGKGTEIGRSFEEIARIIEGVKRPEMLGVCLDTCHINDAGYDLSDFDKILDEFDEVIGLDKLKVIHLNDSKNERGAAKDRHENIGEGTIGYDALKAVVDNPRVDGIPIILETPYRGDEAPYKEEIAMLRK